MTSKEQPRVRLRRGRRLPAVRFLEDSYATRKRTIYPEEIRHLGAVSDVLQNTWQATGDDVWADGELRSAVKERKRAERAVRPRPEPRFRDREHEERILRERRERREQADLFHRRLHVFRELNAYRWRHQYPTNVCATAGYVWQKACHNVDLAISLMGVVLQRVQTDKELEHHTVSTKLLVEFADELRRRGL